MYSDDFDNNQQVYVYKVSHDFIIFVYALQCVSISYSLYMFNLN